MVEYLLAKTDPLQFLFNDKGTLRLYAQEKNNRKLISFDLTIKSIDDRINDFDWDCLLSNFDGNIWFRTDKGRIGKKYKTFAGMLNAINRAIQKEVKATVKSYEIIFDECIFEQA